MPASRPPTSKEDRLAYAHKFLERAPDIDTYKDLHSMGREMVGCAYLSLKNWAKEDEEIAELFHRAMFNRANAYMQRATDDALKTQEFWEQPNFNPKTGDIQNLTRERFTAVNHAKMRIDLWKWHASVLMPDIYGDFRIQLKEQEKQLKKMQEQLDELIKNK